MMLNEQVGQATAVPASNGVQSGINPPAPNVPGYGVIPPPLPANPPAPPTSQPSASSASFQVQVPSTPPAATSVASTPPTPSSYTIGGKVQMQSNPPPVSTSQAGQPMPTISGKGDTGEGGDVFRIVVAIAIVSVVALMASLGYYFYTASQVGQVSPTTAEIVPTLPPQQQTGPVPTLSESDKTSTLETEMAQTSLEDFDGDFAALDQETQGL